MLLSAACTASPVEATAKVPSERAHSHRLAWLEQLAGRGRAAAASRIAEAEDRFALQVLARARAGAAGSGARRAGDAPAGAGCAVFIESLLNKRLFQAVPSADAPGHSSNVQRKSAAKVCASRQPDAARASVGATCGRCGDCGTARQRSAAQLRRQPGSAQATACSIGLREQPLQTKPPPPAPRSANQGAAAWSPCCLTPPGAAPSTGCLETSPARAIFAHPSAGFIP